MDTLFWGVLLGIVGYEVLKTPATTTTTYTPPGLPPGYEYLINPVTGEAMPFNPNPQPLPSNVHRKVSGGIRKHVRGF